MPQGFRRIVQLGLAGGAFALLFWLAFAMPSRAGETAGVMPSAAIEQQVIGKRLDWKSLDGSLSIFGEITFFKDGKVVMSTNLPGLPADEGKWWFDQDRLCTRWAAARDGEAKCYHLIDQGAGRF